MAKNKRTTRMKKAMKDKVKDGQRANDYGKEGAVVFWNKLLREAKLMAPNKKASDIELPIVVKRNYERWENLIQNDDTPPEKKELYTKYLDWLLPFYNGEWVHIDIGR